MFSRLPSYLAEVGVTATPEQLRLFQIHYELLLRWNQKINLSAIREPQEILRRHFAESAFLAKVLAPGPGTLVDVGSGAGFPGVPLKIMSPVTRVVLVESVQKKAAFLKEVTRGLGLRGLEVHAGRLETLETSAEWLTLRAVRLDAALMAEVQRIVPRGTIGALLAAKDVPAAWTAVPIPGRPGSVVAMFHVEPSSANL